MATTTEKIGGGRRVWGQARRPFPLRLNDRFGKSDDFRRTPITGFLLGYGTTTEKIGGGR